MKALQLDAKEAISKNIKKIKVFKSGQCNKSLNFKNIKISKGVLDLTQASN